MTAVNAVARLGFRIANPIVRVALSSPAHRPFSGVLLVLVVQRPPQWTQPLAVPCSTRATATASRRVPLGRRRSTGGLRVGRVYSDGSGRPSAARTMRSCSR